MDIRFYDGIGDILIFESHWSDEYRASIKKIYMRPYHSILLPVFRNCKATKHIRCIPVDYEDYDERAQDWSIVQRFQQIERGEFQFHGSSFLKQKIVNINHIKLPKEFMLVHAQTTTNPMHIRDIRDMQEWEWRGLIRILEERNTCAVVVNSNCADHPPSHPRIIDLINLTTFAESLEILKRASGYIGIDSWLSVLAAQLFGPEQLVIRGPNYWIQQKKHIYYRPHTEFPFVRDTIGMLPKLL